MTTAIKRFYESSNGDTWDLERDEHGRVTVLHRPNLASGGRKKTYELDAFLAIERHSPQNRALLTLVGSLAGDP